MLLITAFAAVIGGLMVTTNTANASDTSSTASDATTATTPDPGSNPTNIPFFGMGGMMMGEQGFGGGRGGHGGGMGGMGNIEVSSEYTATVNAILESDSDVQSLISQGYNVTAIRPNVKSVIAADGTITTKATTANVLLQNGTSGYATVSVDTANAKVTQIVIVTRTVIDKTST